PYAANVVDLMQVCFNGRHEGQSSKIIVGNPASASSEFKAPPIIDLVTVVALVELDLFDALFDIWDAIAIPKFSLETLSEIGFLALSPVSADLIERTRSAIHARRGAILQPGTEAVGMRSLFEVESSTILQEVQAGRFDYLTLDHAAMLLFERRSCAP